jgi:NADH-quinone oxidoreductase subunit N
MGGMPVDLSSVAGMLLALRPEIVLTLAALVLTLWAGFRHGGERDQRVAAWIAVAGLAGTQLVLLWLWASGASALGVPAMMTLDRFRYAADTICLLGALLAVILSMGYVERERLLAPEYYVLLLLAVAGMMFMAGGSDLITIFLGLELMSIAVYVLAGINRRSVYAAEAALKYFLIGAFASAFLLYGIALIYGATGTTNIVLIGAQVQLTPAPGLMLLAGIGLLLIGFGFKVAAVPFHMWAPDVYDGAPTPITGFMAVAVKAAAFAALLRIMLTGFGMMVDAWRDVIWWLAVLTMVLGNLAALSQRTLKRMLAYSSVAHAGYLLAALVAGTPDGAGAFLFYALAYTLMTLGAFAILAGVGREGERDVLIDDLAGLATRRPWLAAALGIFMLSLLGVPGTAGFMGKWYILASVVDSREMVLAVVVVLTSVVSAGYYLPVVMAMYMKPVPATASAEAAAPRLAGATRWVVAVTAVLVLLFGVWPNRAMDLARDGSLSLAPPPVQASQPSPGVSAGTVVPGEPPAMMEP